MIGRSIGTLAVAACVLLAGCDNGATATKPASPEPAPSAPTTDPEEGPNEETEPAESPLALTSAQGEDAPAGNWGTLRGRFVYDGEPPKPDPIVPTKDPEFCGQHNLVDESLVVNDERQLKNVFVYVYVPRGQSLDVHEGYSESADDEVVLDNEDCRFEPHCITLRLSQTLSVQSTDTAEHSIGHNTNLASRQEPFNDTVPATGMDKSFKVAQSYPLPIKCNIHPWMSAHILIREDPYMALSADDGSFEIANIPAGEHEFVFWHERPGTLRDVTLGGGKTDRRGRMKIEIPAGQVVDLGEIAVPAALLKQQF